MVKYNTLFEIRLLWLDNCSTVTYQAWRTEAVR
jgi:hypothetical protein